MKAIVELEQMKTAGPYKADVLPQVKVSTGQTVQTTVQTTVNGGMTGAPGPVVNAVGAGQGSGQTKSEGILKGTNDGVLIPKVNFRKNGGQGGSLQTKGYAYIGSNPVGNSPARSTKVKLTKVVNK